MKNSTLASSVIALLVCTATTALGQAPLIASFGHNGQLVCTNLQPGTTATVEWAPSLDGPWTNTWAGLVTVVADSNGVIRVAAPMFYRVMGVPANPDPAHLVWIPAGTFRMGSWVEEGRVEDEGPLTRVTISPGFWMGRYEVTQEEYLDVMGVNPSLSRNPNSPVEQVRWFEAVAYCEGLTARERAAGWLSAEYAYRLPTEAEWEYACRAGTTTPFHYGNELRSGMANFDGRYEYPPCGGQSYWCYNPSGTYLWRTTAVGSCAPNAWGLYDMHGNVREWCMDWYAESLPGGSVTDPQGAATGSSRVYRGGGWSDQAAACRSANRHWQDPSSTSIFLGFRVVLAPGRAGAAPGVAGDGVVPRPLRLQDGAARLQDAPVSPDGHGLPRIWR